MPLKEFEILAMRIKNADELALNKEVVMRLDEEDMHTAKMLNEEEGGPRRSRRRKGDCVYSRNHGSRCGVENATCGPHGTTQ